MTGARLYEVRELVFGSDGSISLCDPLDAFSYLVVSQNSDDVQAALL